MTGETPSFDIALAHRHFSTDCFNRVWSFVDQTRRTPADDEAMVLAAQASLWHWTQRADCTARNLSVGHWQVSRVSALVKDGPSALRHARRSLELAAGTEPFYIGYAHEALARAALLLNDQDLFARHFDSARQLASTVTNEQDRILLEKDLETMIAPSAKCGE